VFLTLALHSKSIHYNKGELGEICVVQKLYNLPKEQLIDIFGEDASEGIEILNMETLLAVTNIDLIKKAPSLSTVKCRY
jgi:hypothetical protein